MEAQLLQVRKYGVKILDYQTIFMPKGAEVLSFQVQRGMPCLWALVNPMADLVGRDFRLLGTGQAASEYALGHFVGSIQLEEGALVFHLFEAA